MQPFILKHRLLPLALVIAGLAAIQYTLYLGRGIQDVAVMAWPCLVLVVTPLYGSKRATYITAAILFLALLAVFLPHISPSDQRLDWVYFAIIAVFLAIDGFLTRLIVCRMEKSVQQMERKAFEVEEAYEDTLMGLAKALELRDCQTEGHSRKMMELTERLAREVGINDEHELIVLRYGALLHDIGKLSIPDEILKKPGPLTEEEWAVMRLHPEYGTELLSEISHLQRSIDMVLYHHERWDGQGYPRGLRGEAIPLQARLLSITDNYEALSMDRPYRKRWSREQIREYLEENAGTKFDPKMVRVFLKIV